MTDGLEITLLHIQRDSKLNAYSILTKMTIGSYLTLTGHGGGNLDIQRKVISSRKSKIYDRLIEDLKRGCIIPPIVLVVSSDPDEPASGVDWDSDTSVGEYLASLQPEDIAILDGLQRTNAIRKAQESLACEPDRLTAFLARTVRVEIWSQMTLMAILYRMITLNAGQTPMSMKHQLEILNLPILAAARRVRGDLDIWQARDERRRTQAKQFQFAHLIEGYTAFLNRSPFTDSRNQVIEELNRISFLDLFESSTVNGGLEDFIAMVADVDEALCDKYPRIEGEDPDERGPLNYGYQFFGSLPYFVGFCAALGRLYYQDREHARAQVQRLVGLLRSTEVDPLDFGMFSDLTSHIPASAKVGDIQREFVNDAFEQFFILGRSFNEAWRYAGERIR